jgi:hypothetical protein
MDAIQNQRMRAFEGMCLSDIDLRDEQAYHLWKRRLHNRHLHGSGVVFGLKPEAVQTADGDCIEITEGYAIDPEGMDIVVPEGARSEPVPEQPGRYMMFLVYKEEDVAESKRQAYNSTERQETRVRESFQITFNDKEIRNGVEIGRLRVGDGRKVEGPVDMRYVSVATPPEPEDLGNLRRQLREYVDASIELFMKAYVVEQKPVADVRAQLFIQSLVTAEGRLLSEHVSEEAMCDLFSNLMEREQHFLRHLRKEGIKAGLFPHWKTSWQAVKKIQENRPQSDKLDLRLNWMSKALQGVIKAAGKDRENIRGIYYEELDDEG